MANEKQTQEHIKKSAKQTFNDAWKFLGKKKLSKEEKIKLLNLVHASYYLWEQVEERTATHQSIGLWQISRAYAHIGDGGNALLFAEQNIKLSKTETLDGFYTAYAHESAARAYIINQEKGKAEAQIKLALKAIKNTTEKHTENLFKDIEDLKKLL